MYPIMRSQNKHTNALMWKIETNTPISAKAFAAIKNAILSLKAVDDNFLTIDLLNSPRKASFIQVAVWKKGIWLVELNFNEGKIIKSSDDGEYDVKINPWTQYRYMTENRREVIRIFRRLLCKEKFPNLKNWFDCTDGVVRNEPIAWEEYIANYAKPKFGQSKWSCEAKELEELWADTLAERYKGKISKEEHDDLIMLALITADSGKEKEMLKFLKKNHEATVQQALSFLCNMLPPLEIVDDDETEDDE